MRYYLLLLVMLFSSQAVSTAIQSQMDAAIAEIRGEDSVFDSQWAGDENLVMRLSVFDNGTRRDGYAGYICMLLAGHGITDVRVSVVDVVNKMSRELGVADCRHLSR